MIKLNDKYKYLFNSDNRYIILTGGRGSSKSFGVGTFATMLSFEKNHKILFTRYTMTSAHLSIIPEFKEKIELIGANDKFIIKQTEIINQISGSEIIFRGIKTSSGDQTANLKSLQGITTWIVDEAEEMTDEAIFDKIDFSIREKSKQNRIILIMNPTTKEHWIYKRFFEGKGIPDNFTGEHNGITYIYTNYLDNLENLSESYLYRIEELKKNNPEKYKFLILGNWLNKAEGVVFDNWEFGKFDETLSFGFGLDFGFYPDPDALVKVAIDEKRKQIYLKECFYNNNQQLAQLKENIKQHCRSNDLIIADCAEPRLIAELRNSNYNIKPVSKPTIISRIKLTQDYKLIIDENSFNLVKELNNYVWNDKKAGIPIDAYNHLLDASMYYVYTMTKNNNFGF